jgi:hypothetical protein
MDLYRSEGAVLGHVAEIIVPATDGRGTGYLLTPSLILTAAHVVAGASSAWVRFEARTGNEWRADVDDMWCDEDLDVALLSIEPRDGMTVRPVAFGRLGAFDNQVPFSTVGFPRFKVRKDDTKYRDSAHVTGKIAPLSNRKEGTLELSIDVPEPSAGGDRSPWEGMSGAAVFCGGRIVGIVAKHHPLDGPGKLAANRVEQWLASPVGDRLRELLGAAIVPATSDDLPDVAQPRWSRDLTRSLQSWAEAEMLANSGQPYQLVDEGVPELTRSYVERSGVESSGERTSVADVLSRYRHVLVEAPAGIGKSSLTYHMARKSAIILQASLRSSRLPDETEYIAVRVPARDLAVNRPLPDAIVSSVSDRLGLYQSENMAIDQFGAVTPGGLPWLIMVDGLDEIIDGEKWRKVVAAIAADMTRAESPYRWLITTRPVPGHGLDALRQVPGVASYTLEVFDDNELYEMARAWLHDYSSDNTEYHIEEFIDQAKSNLHELVRVPLLAAVALLLYRRSAEVGLPTSRPGLYEALVTYFLHGRGKESERQGEFRRLIADAGGTSELADFLYPRRHEILHELARQTLEDGQPTLGRAIAWINQNAAYIPKFLHNWDAAVGGILASTGLVTLESARSLAWIHQTVPEYLVARRRADSLSGTWPPADLEPDALLREALAEGVQGEQATLTIACCMVGKEEDNEDEISRRFLSFLLAHSGDYDYLLKYHNSDLLVGNDSYNLDSYVMLAGRLLGQGVPADESLSERVIRRLLYRARSIFHAQEYCGIVAVQPGKHMARQALDDLIADKELPIVARADAAAAIARIFGFNAAAEAVESLAAFSEKANWVKQRMDGAHLGVLPDGRLVVAEEFAQLGEPARDIVAKFLDLAQVPAEDETGCLVAAESAAKVNDIERLHHFVSMFEPKKSGDLPALDFAPLMIRAGLRDKGLEIIEETKVRKRDSSAFSGVAKALLTYGETDLAVDLARFAMREKPREDGSYEVLVLAGHADEVIAALRRFDVGSHKFDVSAWVDVAQVLRRNCLAGVVTESLGDLLTRGIMTAKLASLLIDIGDDRGHQMMCLLAADAEVDPAERYAAASYLLDTADRGLGIEALLALPRQRGFFEDANGQSVHDYAEGTARSLALIGETAEAIDVLCRLIPRRTGQNLYLFALLCRLDPPRGIAEINKRLAESDLREWDIMNLLMAKASALKAISRQRNP